MGCVGTFKDGLKNKVNVKWPNGWFLPTQVAQVNIGGIPGCSAFGFEALSLGTLL